MYINNNKKKFHKSSRRKNFENFYYRVYDLRAFVTFSDLQISYKLHLCAILASRSLLLRCSLALLHTYARMIYPTHYILRPTKEKRVYVCIECGSGKFLITSQKQKFSSGVLPARNKRTREAQFSRCAAPRGRKIYRSRARRLVIWELYKV